MSPTDRTLPTTDPALEQPAPTHDQPETASVAVAAALERGPSPLRTTVTTIGLQVATLIGFLGLWQALVTSEIVNPFLIPSPLSIVEKFVEDSISLVTGGPMLGHFMTTLSEIVVGFLFASFLGIVVAILLTEFTVVRRIAYPYVIALSATPRVAFAPLFIVWFGFGLTSKVMMVAAIATFPILVNTIAGLGAADRDTLKLMRSLGSTRWQTFTKLRLRTSLPYVFAGFESGIIFASVGAVVAEFTGGNRGLGYLTLVGQEMFRLDQAFSAIIFLALQGVALHRIVLIARRRVVFWQPDEKGGFLKT